jgi:hypothetical protein
MPIEYLNGVRFNSFKKISEFPIDAVDSGNSSMSNGLIAIRTSEVIKAIIIFEEVK